MRVQDPSDCISHGTQQLGGCGMYMSSIDKGGGAGTGEEKGVGGMCGMTGLTGLTNLFAFGTV